MLEARERLHLIFVTAYVHAIDYLLKPVDPVRLAQSIRSVRRLIEAPDAGQVARRLDALVQALRSSPVYVRRLLIQENCRSIFLDVSWIDWVEAVRNYPCICSLAFKLDPAVFRRINRSEIVNTERIIELRCWFHSWMYPRHSRSSKVCFIIYR